MTTATPKPADVQRRLARAFDRLSCAHADLDEARAELRELPALYEGPVRAQIEQAMASLRFLSERVGFTIKPGTADALARAVMTHAARAVRTKARKP